MLQLARVGPPILLVTIPALLVHKLALFVAVQSCPGIVATDTSACNLSCYVRSSIKEAVVRVVLVVDGVSCKVGQRLAISVRTHVRPSVPAAVRPPRIGLRGSSLRATAVCVGEVVRGKLTSLCRPARGTGIEDAAGTSAPDLRSLYVRRRSINAVVRVLAVDAGSCAVVCLLVGHLLL